MMSHRAATSPGGSQPQTPIHTPMSERQQLALIKRLELAANASNSPTHNDSLLVSPPRAPLQVVNGPNPMTTPSTPSGLALTKFSEEISIDMAMHRQQSPALERLIKKITKRNSKGETPLHTAAIKGSPRLVRQLLVMGADPNAQDNAEWSPLHEACNRGNRAVVKILLQFGADLNLKGFAKDSPLHDAARNGHLKVVKFLIKSGADIFATNANGKTPRGEAESTLEKVDSDNLVTTIQFLEGEETRRNRFGKELLYGNDLLSDDIEMSNSLYSDGSDDESDLDDPDNDIAKFLGVAKSSPDVQKAFKSLGLISNSVKPKSRLATPAKSIERRRKSESSKAEKLTSLLSTKQRLNFEQEALSDTGSCDTKTESELIFPTEMSGESVAPETIGENESTVNCDESKKRRMLSGPEEENRCKKKRKKRRDLSEDPDDSIPESPQNLSLTNPLISFDSNGRQVLKVPPLKIILSNSREDENRVCTDGGARMAEVEGRDEQSNKQDDYLSKGWSEPQTVGVNLTKTDSQRSGQPENESDKQNSESNVWESRSVTSPLPVQFHLKKKQMAMRASSESSTLSSPEQISTKPEVQPPNDIEKYLELRRQVDQRRKNIFPVIPKPPEGLKDYLMQRRTYLLQENAQDRLRSLPKLEPPPSLKGMMRDLFIEQEDERYKLRLQQLVEKEKLVLSVEQEILRVHCQAARALANQPFPYSFCTILKDEEIYNKVEDSSSNSGLDDKNRDSRSRFNGRIFLSWLQDVDDKWEKIKEQMLLRHHRESEALNASQKIEWEDTIGVKEGNPIIDDLHIPMVFVSDNFDLPKGCHNFSCSMFDYQHQL